MNPSLRKFFTENDLSIIVARQVPFRITFKTDGDEANVGAATATNTNELGGIPSGAIGFSLKYVQNSC